MITGRFEYKEAEYLYSIEVDDKCADIDITLPFGIDCYRSVNFIDEIMEKVDVDMAYIKELENRLNHNLTLSARKKILSFIDGLSHAYIVNNIYWDTVENDFDDMGIDFALPYTTISISFFFDRGIFDDEKFTDRFYRFTNIAKKSSDYYVAYCDGVYNK